MPEDTSTVLIRSALSPSACADALRAAGDPSSIWKEIRSILWASRLMFPTDVDGTHVRVRIMNATNQWRPTLGAPFPHSWQLPKFSGELRADTEGGSVLAGTVHRQRLRWNFRIISWAFVLVVGGAVLGILSALLRGRAIPWDVVALIVVVLLMLVHFRSVEQWGEAYGAQQEELLIGFIEAAIQGEREPPPGVRAA